MNILLYKSIDRKVDINILRYTLTLKYWDRKKERKKETIR